MKVSYTIPELPLQYDLETKAVLKQVNQANRKLAELKGVARTIPNEAILISSLTLQEARESSEVENIVTTHDELYRADLALKKDVVSASTKEVLNYREAIVHGFSIVRKQMMLTNNTIKSIQEKLEHNSAGFRSVPGTALKKNDGEVVYTPPQNHQQILEYMNNLEKFINVSELSDLDPLIKMAIIHHQFESIHPFYDGNGRTGRIINVLYLVMSDMLDLPILYLSRYVTRNKGEYYRLIQAIRDNDGNNQKEWEEWILFILKGVEETAEDTIRLVKGIGDLMNKFKNILRPAFGNRYKHELLNNLFFHPYTKIEFVQRDMMVERKTAARYLENIVEIGLLKKIKIWNTNYYVNTELVELFMNRAEVVADNVEVIESVS